MRNYLRAQLNCRIYKTCKRKDIDTYFFSLQW